MQTALTLLISGFQMFEIYLIYQCFFQKSKCLIKHLEIAYILLYAILSAEYLWINIPIINSLSCFIGLFCMVMLYEERWKNRLIALFFNYGAMFTAEAIVSALFGYVNADLFSVREYYSYFGMVCLPLVQLLLVLIIRNLRNLKRKEPVSTSYWIISIVLPIISFYLYFQICSQTDISRGNLFGCSAAILLINVLVIFLYDRQIRTSMLEREKKYLELQNQYQEKQYTLMSDSVERLQKNQHDFRNHLNSISYFGEKQDWETMKSYISNIRKVMLEGEQYIDTGSMIFDAILNYKLQEAYDKGIDLKIDVKIPSDIVIVPFDITTILGNLLDNCIEATEGKEDGWIKVKIFYRQNRLNIQTENSYSNELILKGDLYQTSKEDGDKHGYGLRNVREVVERYEGVMQTEGKDGVFTVKITLFLE